MLLNKVTYLRSLHVVSEINTPRFQVHDTHYRYPPPPLVIHVQHSPKCGGSRPALSCQGSSTQELRRYLDYWKVIRENSQPQNLSLKKTLACLDPDGGTP